MTQNVVGRLPAAVLRHAAAVVGAYTLLFTWVWARPLVENGYLAGTDLFDYYLPIFFSPITFWSTYELSGLPAFADSQNAYFYPPNLLFARLLPSWTAYIVSAYVLAASFTYAYVYNRTRSVVAAACAGLAYGLSESMMERVDHLTIVHTTAWLPLLVLALDRLRGGWHSGWVAAGAFAVGSSFLAGHTQPAIYIVYVCALYALVGGVYARAGVKYYAAVFVLFALGGLLAAISLVPLYEASGQVVRQAIGFGQFVSHSNTPAQMLSALVPQIAHEGREAPTYVGLATLVFALLALRDIGTRWIVGFWWVVAGVALVAGAGDTPVARLMYELPFYDSFRVVARHLVLAAFALAVLAGVGLAAVIERRVSLLAVGGAAFVVLLAVVATTIAAGRWPEQFEVEAATRLQVAVGVVTAAVVLGLTWRPRATAAAAALVAVLVFDLLHALPYPVRLSGVDAPIVAATALEPSVHAQELRAWLQPGHHRMLTPAGVTVDPIVPGAFGRLWRIPVAGAYGAILTPQYAALAEMGTTGTVQRQVLADDSTALDLLAVKYVAMRRRDFASGETFDAHGGRWAADRLDLSAGPRECGQAYPRQSTYALPAQATIARVMVVAALRCSEDVAQGTEVATLSVEGGDGTRHSLPLRAGVELADAVVGMPGIRHRARHSEAAVFERDADGQANYLVTVDLPAPADSVRLRLTVSGTPGWLQVDRIAAVDAAGRPVTVAAPDVLFHDRERWRVTRTAATSPLSDRGRDEQVPGEEEVVLLENLRVRPRAWLAREVVPLDERAMVTAVHHSYLPDGRRFDPAVMALVEPRYGRASTSPAGDSAVHVETVDNGRITVQVASTGGGFLVLSESFYPGWRARIGEREVAVQRTNLSLQGLPVPPGQQTVTFEFAPLTLRVGAAASTLAAAALVGLMLIRARGVRRARHQTTSATSEAT